ncbi:hypothetical protein ACE3MZ_01030 [Paenibacillus sp. WLX1005]|uniref:hypothetical protein n=1 Tax=Paenibacillus sp. WLX1005 TaxID=3243766 RepID=UPI0039841FC3
MNQPSNESVADSILDRWRRQIEQQLIPLEQEIRNVTYTEQALEQCLRIMPDLTPVAAQLYRLLVELTIYSRVMKPLHRTTGSTTLSLGYHTRLAATEVQNRLQQLLSAPLAPLEQAEERVVLGGLLKELRQSMLYEVRDTHVLLTCYYLLWRGWLMSLPQAVPLLERELKLLERAFAQADQQKDNRQAPRFAYNSGMLARSYIYFLSNEDEQALDWIRQAAERHDFYPERMPDLMGELAAAEQWERLSWWLEQLVPVLRRQYSDLQHYGDYWELVIQQLPDRESQMWQALGRMLPLGGRIYEDRLLAYGKYREWMDYQLSAGKDPANYKVTELKPLENNAPELLLPFYHQAVERHMSHKNRDGYKAAVKLLKRLSKLYAKLKQDEVWREYMEQFAAQHSRLRALQEELRKGKLIP